MKKKSLLDDVSEEEIMNYRMSQRDKLYRKLKMTCRICHGVFATQSNMRRHMKKVHQSVDLVQSALPTAGAPQRTNGTLTKPPTKVEASGSSIKPKQRCLFCERYFEHKILFDCHRCPNLPENQKKIHCQCGKTFNSKSSFEFHSFFHESIVEINFVDT